MKPSRYSGFKSLPTPHALNTTEALDSDVLVFLRRAAVARHTETLGEAWVLGLCVVRACRRIDRYSGVLVGRLRLFFPFPLCRQGKCYRFGRDYVWRLGTLFGYEGKGIYL